MRIFQIKKSELESSNLVDLFPFVTWTPEFAKFFMGSSGKEHYTLLSHLSWQLERNETVVDVGTFLGFSALALSHNQTAKVVTYDLESKIPKDIDMFTPLHRKNIEFRIGDVLKDLPELIQSPFMFLDTNHDGGFEREFLAKLEHLKFKGILFCDDIHLNDAMKMFWQSVTLPKMDLTSVGHWSGTGAILFDPNTTNLELLD